MIGLAAVNWAAARDLLPVLRSPSYAALVGAGSLDSSRAELLDLAVLAASTDRDDARRRVADVVTEEVARILRLPRGDIGPARPLSELGLDSLMGVELAAALQARFVLGAPPADLAASQSVMGLADLLLDGCSAGSGDAASALARRHLGSAAAIDAATSTVERSPMHTGSPP